MKFIHTCAKGWGSSKIRTAAYKGKGGCYAAYVRTHLTIFFHVFINMLVLLYLVLCVEIESYLYSDKMGLSETVIFLQRGHCLTP